MIYNLPFFLTEDSLLLRLEYPHYVPTSSGSPVTRFRFVKSWLLRRVNFKISQPDISPQSTNRKKYQLSYSRNILFEMNDRWFVVFPKTQSLLRPKSREVITGLILNSPRRRVGLTLTAVKPIHKARGLHVRSVRYNIRAVQTCHLQLKYSLPHLV